jgi:type IV secretory pathway protease TraF
MQCASCHFENMPGVPNCGRCGAVLNLAKATVEVYPPRAKRWIKPWRRYFYFITRRQFIPRGWVANWDKAIRTRVSAVTRNMIPWDLLLRIFVPGWPQLYLGRKLQGRIFFWGYLACLPLGLLYAGTVIGGLLLGLAISLHASSIADLVIAHADNRESRLLYSIACLSLVALVLYIPAVELIVRVAMPQQFIMDSPPFQAGDVIIYNPSAYRHAAPQVGDMVLYRLPYARFYGQREGHRNVIYDFTGQTVVGRLIAGPGQKITVEKGRLMVNGELSPWSELFADRFREGFTVTMLSDNYFILTGLAGAPINPIPNELWLQLSNVSRANISGKVFFRTQPLWQFGPIR